MHDSIAFLLNDTARLFRRAFNEGARSTGITALQWRMIVYLRRNPGISQAALADLIEVEPITLSRMVDRMTEAGLVERRPHPQDRRRHCLHLAAGGEALLDGFRDTAEALIDEATAGLSADEQERLALLLDRIRQNLSRKVTDHREADHD